MTEDRTPPSNGLMTDHDPLCDWYGAFFPEGADPVSCPDCAEIRRARADERDRIAQAIEAREADTSPLHPARDAVLAAYRVAARIARDGGPR